MRWRPVVLLGSLLFSWSTIWAETFEPAMFPSLISSIKVVKPLDFCGEAVPIGSQQVLERLEKELMLTLWNRPQVILWLKRSPRYLAPITGMLKADGMPEDLKYVAIAESALRPHARSRSGAVGFWQFMEATGRKYGLAIGSRIDERRNLFASTRAAIRYFKELHEVFGSWTLAAAAYNMGEKGLMAEILEQQTHTYYDLYLPLETQRYLFRILSAKLILSNQERYGFQLSKSDYYPPLAFDRVQLKCSQDTPLRVIARAAKTRFKEIKDLNPEIRGHYLAAGNHTILIPKATSEGFHSRYQQLLRSWLTDRKGRIYVVKAGDNLSAIARRFDVPVAALLIWNRLDPKAPIHPGDELVIYGNELIPSNAAASAP